MTEFLEKKLNELHRQNQPDAGFADRLEKELRTHFTRQETKPRRWQGAVTLAAACAAILLIAGIGWFTWTRFIQLQISIENTIPMTAENIENLQLIETYGKGMVYDVGWTPASGTLTLATSTGLYHAVELAGDHVPVYAFDYSHDGTTLLTIERTQIVKRRVATGEVLLRIDLSDKEVNMLQADAQHLHFATIGCQSRSNNGCSNYIIRFFDGMTGEQEGQIEGIKTPRFAVNPDWSLLAYPDQTNDEIVIIELPSQEIKTVLTVEALNLSSITFSLDGEQLLAGIFKSTPTLNASSDRILIWEVDQFGSEPVPQELRGTATSAVNNIALHPTQPVIATTNYSGDISIWENGERVQLFGTNDDQYAVIAFSPDGERLATASFSGLVQIWNWKTASEIERIESFGSHYVQVEVSHDSQKIFARGFFGNIRTWAMLTGEEDTIGPLTDALRIDAMAVSPDKVAFTTLRYFNIERDLWVWTPETASGEQIDIPELDSGFMPPYLGFAPDNTLFVSSEHKSSIWQWDLGRLPHGVSLPEAKEIRSNHFNYQMGAFTSDGRYLAASVCREANTDSLCTRSEIQLWDTETGKPAFTLITDDTSNPAWHSPLAISHDSNILAAVYCKLEKVAEWYGCASWSIHLWRLVPTDSPSLPFATVEIDHDIYDLAFVPGDDILLTAITDENLLAWHINEDNGSDTSVYTSSNDLRLAYGSLAVSRDGKYLVTSGSGIVHVWGVADN